MNVIKDCPFCGKYQTNIDWGQRNDGQYYHFCWFCMARGPFALTKEDAIKEWNKRIKEN